MGQHLSCFPVMMARYITELEDKELGDLPKEFPSPESKSIIMVGLVISREVSMSQWCGRPESLRPGK